MIHTYNITGMTCDGCRTKVEKALNTIEGVQSTVTLEPPIATIIMEKHIPVMQLQDVLFAAGKYTIAIGNHTDSSNKPAEKSCCATHSHGDKKEVKVPVNADGKYYCPMHCEGEKVYDKAGDCPVCGMDLVKAPKLTVSKTLYTCPMHPEVISETPGSCPICGMDLVPMNPTDTEDQKRIKIWLKK